MGDNRQQYPKIAEGTARAEVAFPELLAKDYERILERAESLWGTKDAEAYFDSLIMESHDGRGARQGFALDVMDEIVMLKQVHEFLYPPLDINPFDPFSGYNSATSVKHSGSAANEAMDFMTFSPRKSDDGMKLDADGEPAPVSLSTLAAEVAQSLAAPPADSPPADGEKKHIDWHEIRTQRDLLSGVEKCYRGEVLYPQQGKPVGEILVEYGVIDEPTLHSLRNTQKRPANSGKAIGKILVELGIVRHDEVMRALCVQSGILMVDVLAITIPSETLKLITGTVAREKQVVPVTVYQDTLFLAVADPFAFNEHSYFSFMTGKKIKPVFSSSHEIVNRLSMYGTGRSTGEAKAEFMNLTKKVADFSAEKSAPQEIIYADVSENDSVIISLVNQMILNAVEVGASDIHVELFQGHDDSNIRFRRDGNMEHFSNFPNTYHQAVVSRIKIMANLDISERRRPQDGKISFSTQDERRIDLRVVTIPTMRGVEFVTIRILASGDPVSLGDLGMAERDMQVFRDVSRRPYGLILVCGPTGSGKTTTLHSVLKELNTGDRKIWTAEDPVEIVQDNLCQVQVNSKIGMTFATVLRSFLRADPDIIMIGEMRDQETAKIALEASMTGHLVLSTLHTNSASETVARLIDLEIDPYNLSDALLAILAQRLARKLCPVCAKSVEAALHELDELANEYHLSARGKIPTASEREATVKIWREKFGVEGKLYLKYPVGCKECSGGYKGRIGLYELLQTSPSLRHLIRHQSSATEYMEAGIDGGMRTLKQDGIEKVLRGITDIVQVRSVCI
ncbi:MAG: GspE/PulE family protein [Gallionella sp.]|nr:GspE/PulE family protein [Gallionella sp.]